MSRDHRKFQTFVLADNLAVDVYRVTAALPDYERYGLQAQIRRAAVSVPTNIVEGSTRPSTTDYCRFLTLSMGSSDEAGYLLHLATRLGFLDLGASAPLVDQYSKVSAGLMSAINKLRSRD